MKGASKDDHRSKRNATKGASKDDHRSKRNAMKGASKDDHRSKRNAMKGASKDDHREPKTRVQERSLEKKSRRHGSKSRVLQRPRTLTGGFGRKMRAARLRQTPSEQGKQVPFRRSRKGTDVWSPDFGGSEWLVARWVACVSSWAGWVGWLGAVGGDVAEVCPGCWESWPIEIAELPSEECSDGIEISWRRLT